MEKSWYAMPFRRIGFGWGARLKHARNNSWAFCPCKNVKR
jgi:hypothetical protein